MWKTDPIQIEALSYALIKCIQNMLQKWDCYRGVREKKERVMENE
jgi:hypothetical protein